jgi:RNA polymerase sigma factor (sigma-70 family)
MSATGTALQSIEHQIPQAYMEELRQLVSHDLPRFYRHAYRQLENPHDAEDAVQNAIVSAYKNLSQFGSRAQLSTWFMAIVINAARMQRRRRRSFVSLTSSPVQPARITTPARKKPVPSQNCAICSLELLTSSHLYRERPSETTWKE